jgi:very-short-patch-repair endonuclease
MIVELDGHYWHNTEKQKALDRQHEEFARSLGYDIIRFSDIIIKKTKGVCFDRVIEHVGSRTICTQEEPRKEGCKVS